MSYLKISNFTKYINKNKILDDISFELEKGKVLVLLGKSGAGKTTLLRNINFLDFPNQGTLELDGEMLYNYNGILFEEEYNGRKAYGASYSYRYFNV